MSGGLIRIVAPHFVAGLVVDDKGIVRRAAPIVAWAIGRHVDKTLAYFRRKGWVVEALD